jgi:predicted RNA-binding Zn-ribbon protein involved in translation (DUF1610 family)
MSIKTPCISCGRTLSAPDNAAGKRARCPSCGTIQQLPGNQPPPPEPDVLEPEAVEEPAYDAPPADPFAEDPFGAPTDEYAVAADAPPLPPAGASSSGGGEQRKPCPMCGEMIPTTAMKCRFCNTIFDPKLRKAEAKRKTKTYDASDEDLSGAEWVACFLCSGIACIFGIVWMIQGKPKGKKMFFVSLAVQLVIGAIRAAIESNR